MKELQVLLAQRLLKEGDLEKEACRQRRAFFKKANFSCYQRRNIEILKIRFGDAALQVCEVMLKDITDSRRIDDHVQSHKSVRCLFPQVPAQGTRPLTTELLFILQSIVHPTIISRHFWPALDSGDIVMPGQFQV